tara:strand:- start:1341 stop:2003 length:663 start_codon:yes stop_codon:yes gene_type:complete
MSRALPPVPTGDFWRNWAIRLNTHLGLIRSKLAFKSSGDSATEDGIILWDAASGHAVISLGNSFEPLSYGHNGFGSFFSTATHTAGSTNAATAITWNNAALSHDIAIDATHTSRLNFARTGTYKIDFSCELKSGNSSSKTIYIWPKKNGANLNNSTIVFSVKNSGESKVVSRSVLLQLTAGDYLESYFAVTDTGLTIAGTAATSFSPVAPSATIQIIEVR